MFIRWLKVRRATKQLRLGAAKERMAACRALGKLGGEAATAALLEALDERDRDGSKDVRQVAAEELGKLAAPAAVEPLCRCLVDHIDMMEVAVKALGAIGDERAVAPLTMVLESPAPVEGARGDDLRRAAGDALGRIGSPLALTALLRSPSRCYALSGLFQVNDPAVIPVMIEEVRKDWGRDAGRAAEKLGKIGDLSAIEPIKELVARAVREPRRFGYDHRYVMLMADGALQRLGVPGTDPARQAHRAEQNALEARLEAEQQQADELRRIEARTTAGATNCQACNAALMWWSGQVVRATFRNVAGATPGSRPPSFAGVCTTCRDGFCREHAPAGCCPFCGKPVTGG